jgi:NADPH-dependent 2,4-dienoyl-CoA reductase/sulfur reductase-like enzyme
VSGRTVVIVGAGLAGSRCAETLRAKNFDGRVLLLGDEPAPPYERPGLSKEHLLDGTRDLHLRPPEFWQEKDIELRLGERAGAVDLTRRTVGRKLRWDALVLATGARARLLPGSSPSGVHTLRTLADAARLREALVPGSRLVILGAGFVGAEVASTARALGVDVTLVDRAPLPLTRVLGSEVGGLLASRMAEHDVDLRTSTGLERLVADERGHMKAVELSDGSRVACDAVLVAIGAEPADELIGDGGGIDTDGCGRTALPGMFACGDVANWWRPSLGRHVRVEHWTSAAGQAAAVANAIVGDETPYDDLPFFWSDQFGLRLQHVGHAEEWARVELDGTRESFLARYIDREGRVAAILLANRPREIGAARRELQGSQQQAAA